MPFCQHLAALICPIKSTKGYCGSASVSLSCCYSSNVNRRGPSKLRLASSLHDNQPVNVDICRITPLSSWDVQFLYFVLTKAFPLGPLGTYLFILLSYHQVTRQLCNLVAYITQFFASSKPTLHFLVGCLLLLFSREKAP